jgi:hypothetical protein
MTFYLFLSISFVKEDCRDEQENYENHFHVEAGQVGQVRHLK